MKRWTIITVTLALTALLVWIAVVQMPDGRLHAFFLDVEAGQAAIIQTGGATILIDGGPRPSKVLTALGRYLPFWQRTLDLVVATHQGTSAISSLLDVTERYEIRHVLAPPMGSHPTAAYGRWRALLSQRRIPITEAQVGTILTISDGTVVEVLAIRDEGMTVVIGAAGVAVLLAGASVPETALDVALVAVPVSRSRAAPVLPNGPGSVVLFTGAKGTSGPAVITPPNAVVYSTALHGTIELVAGNGHFTIRVQR